MPGGVSTTRSLRDLLLAAALATGTWGLGAAQGATPADACAPVPFDQQVDVEAITVLAHEPPQRLLARIEGLGIDVRRVPGTVPGRPINPLLAALAPADAELLQRAQWHDAYEGRAIPRGASCCGLQRDTVLIRESASTYTLLHEVVHLLIVPADGVVLRDDIELRFALAFHRLQVYQRRLYDDPWRLLDPAWRRDIVDAQQDVAALLFDRIRIGQSQEAIVERVLAACIDERSPHFDPRRRDEGRRYGEAMIDNAIDVFNTLDAAVEFNDATVTHLREDLRAGRLREGPDARLSAQDRDEFAAQQRRVRDAMARTRDEIEVLKRYYAR